MIVLAASKLEIKIEPRALKVSSPIERTWKFAERAIGCDEGGGAPSPVVLVRFCLQNNKADLTIPR